MKRIFVTLSLLAVVAFFACDREEFSGIPYATVDYELFDADRDKLLGQPSFIVVDKARNASDKIGYGGLLIVHGPLGDYYAFDLSCPVEARRDKLIEAESNGVYATCPHCGARFDISTRDGFPSEGSKYRLTTYQVILNMNSRPTRVVN